MALFVSHGSVDMYCEAPFVYPGRRACGTRLRSNACMQNAYFIPRPFCISVIVSSMLAEFGWTGEAVPVCNYEQDPDEWTGFDLLLRMKCAQCGERNAKSKWLRGGACCPGIAEGLQG